MIPASENAYDTAENAVIGIGEYASLCIHQIPYDLSATKRYPAISSVSVV